MKSFFDLSHYSLKDILDLVNNKAKRRKENQMKFSLSNPILAVTPHPQFLPQLFSILSQFHAA